MPVVCRLQSIRSNLYSLRSMVVVSPLLPPSVRPATSCTATLQITNAHWPHQHSFVTTSPVSSEMRYTMWFSHSVQAMIGTHKNDQVPEVEYTVSPPLDSHFDLCLMGRVHDAPSPENSTLPQLSGLQASALRSLPSQHPANFDTNSVLL